MNSTKNQITSEMFIRINSVVFVLCLVLNMIVADDMQDLINMLHKTCSGETGATEELIARAQKGDFADDENLKCYTKCIFEQMATIDDDGIIDVDAVIALLPDDVKSVLEPGVRKCGTQKGASPCENAWLTNKCYYEFNPEKYFLP